MLVKRWNLEIEQSNFGVYGNPKDRYCFTLLLKDKFCKRGEYCEEIDVFGDGVGTAKKIGNRLIEAYYAKGLKIAKVIVNY